MVKEYTHAAIGEEVRFISGYYEVTEERRMPHGEGELLVVFGNAIIDNSCCGRGGCRYALVPGYVVNWKHRKNEDGLEVTEVRPVREEQEKKEIRKKLQESEILQQVNFL